MITNMKYIGKLIIIIAIIAFNCSCRKTYSPSDRVEDSSILNTLQGKRTATLGNYGWLKNTSYENSLHWLSELPSDEVAQGQNSSDDVTNIYKYTHLKTSTTATAFFQQSFYVISAANKIIRIIPDNASAAELQIKGENLFLRAFLNFNLLRIFGRPYTQNPTTNLGIPILTENMTEQEEATVKRSSVETSYASIIADLTKAALLLTENKSNIYATKEAANALLARVYLYQNNNTKAIELAKSVINSNKYQLLQGSDYLNYFRVAPETNKETIFAVNHTKTENWDYLAISSLYYSGDANGNALGQGESGWGEIYASAKLYNLYMQNPTDKRLGFISPYKAGGVQQMNTKLTPNVPIYYVNKYSLQEGVVNLSSPVYIRFAEMYLIRAEANAKSGNIQAALDDVNIIRGRAGIPALTVADVVVNMPILDIVLREKYMELAFEGHRAYDLFRNNKAVERNYPGTHSTLNGTVNQTIQPTDLRVVAYIPQTEIDKNSNLEQNP